MTKTDRRAKRRSQCIENKRFQRKPVKSDEPATIRLTKKERKQKLAERVLNEIKEQYDPMRRDASIVTNFVSRQGGLIKGKSLDDLYKMLAIQVLKDKSEIGTYRAEVAVTYACTSKWLVRHEAPGATEWMYAIPQVEFDVPQVIHPRLTVAA